MYICDVELRHGLDKDMSLPSDDDVPWKSYGLKSPVIRLFV